MGDVVKTKDLSAHPT